MKVSYTVRWMAGVATALCMGFVPVEGQTVKQTDPLVSHIDKSIRPQDDFFLFANGTWFKQHPIPATEHDSGIFQLLEDTINAQVLNICKESAVTVNAAKGSNKQKIGDFYASGMDSISRNRQGIELLTPDLKAIDNIKDLNGVLKSTAYLYSVSSAPFFSIYIAQDDKNSSHYIVNAMQGGLSMPDRSYYVDNDEASLTARQKFVEYATKIFSIMGYPQVKAEASAKNLLAFETKIAAISRKREDTRDPFTNYHKQSLAQFQAQTPNLDWYTFFKGIGLSQVDSVNVGQPEFYTSLNVLLKTTPLADLKDYLKFNYLNGLASFVDDKTYQAEFDFYSRTLRGIQKPSPRWKRVVSMTNNALGDLIGEVYVEEYLPKGTKEKLEEIGKAVKEQFAERIRHLDWMSDATKDKALMKLDAIVMKLGYPEKWKDMSNVSIDRNSYVRNVMNINKWSLAYMVNKYGKPVDRNEWDMEPQTYNAYYNPSNNEIVIPGCNIIVPGYEKRMADDAILYAIVGGTFGHELTHGFDDQGCKYDADGNLRNWWTDEDKKKFDARTAKIVKQFNDYETVKGLHINGSNTQGENIADLGGIIVAYKAFQQTEQYKLGKKIAGYTPDQRFFLGYALAWMQNQRPEAIATQVKSNEHSPAKWRVLGPLSNMPEFYKAFNVTPGDKMYRPENERVKIW